MRSPRSAGRARAAGLVATALAATGLAGALAGRAALARFRAERDVAAARLAARGRLVATRRGPIEYAEAGEGPPVLVIHGAAGGFDQGLEAAHDLVAAGYRVIAVSRVGYLGTPMPPGGASAADQADAHAALLDALGIAAAIVMALSAGARSALALAADHPQRVRALLLVAPAIDAPGARPRIADTPQSRAALAVAESGSDLALWTAMRVARPALLRMMGVPAGVEARASARERARIDRLMRTAFPLAPRAAGIAADARGAEPPPLARVRCPTLIVTAEDDLFHTVPGARRAAATIPDAALIVLRTGGHLLVERRLELRGAALAFLERHGMAGAPGV
ncbi:alpha/beta hydrolase [Salinarimonas sp.]|uniref:alpha/beta fold hydrolase n=1 Tax=Salinarimonas sp. TaxID=2766526 RepID=UPI0032D944C0